MNKQEICEKLIAIVSAAIRNRIDPEDITAETDLINDKALNSLEGLEVLVRAENEFEIQIEDDDLTVELVRTVSNLADYVAARLENA